MKVLIDACVLYPTVMREIVLGVAAKGMFTPLWSPRILEEWARAAARLGDGQDLVARGEIAMMRAAWPKAEILPHAGDEARLWLPDRSDIHVLAAAIAGSADTIMTLNAKDFPRNILAEEGLERCDPDGFLRALYDTAPARIAEVAEAVRQKAEHLSGEAKDMRKLLKKARLPRLGKALAAA